MTTHYKMGESTVNEATLLANGYRKYTGGKIDIFYNTEMCTHSGNCVRGNKKVFEVGRRPWIMPDNASSEEVMNIIDTCPSMALKYIQKGGNEDAD